jgi:hypothetical protein
VVGELAVEPQQHRLTRTGLTDAYLGVEAGVRVAAPGDDPQDPARMLPCHLGRGADRVVLGRLVGDDDQREHLAGGGTAHPVPGRGQRVLDLAGAGVREIDDHA